MEISSPLPFWTTRILKRTDTAGSLPKSLEPFPVRREPVHRPFLERAVTGDLRGVPISGKDIEVSYTNVMRVVAGRIAENWVSVNQLALAEQLGMYFNS